MGAEIHFIESDHVVFQLRPNFEYGLLVFSGDIKVGDISVEAGTMLFIKAGKTKLDITVTNNARLILLGGEPFTEGIVMWWNFIGRNHDEIVQMRNDWESGSVRFGNVVDNINDRISAPLLPNLELKPRFKRKA